MRMRLIQNKYKTITHENRIMESEFCDSSLKRRSKSDMIAEDQIDVDPESSLQPNNGKNSIGSKNFYIDRWNIALLFFLYLLQGIPLGLTAAIPIILQNRKVDFAGQAEFSFVSWPFSLKLLWAPIVDSVYSAKFGRRKSWLIPVQYLLGIFMLFISYNVDDWLGDDAGKKIPKIQLLTIMFFCCNFLAATQDIAVDGWALTMLHRKNVGYASTCNSVGQTAGFFFGYVMFIALDSPDLCNTLFRSVPQPTGLVSFSGFMYFWAVVYIVSTTLLAIFKADNSLSIVDDAKEIDLNIRQSYKLLYQIAKLKPVQIVALMLITCKIGFAACDVVAPLKLIQFGVPKDKFALMAIPLMPFQIVLPLVISRYIVGPRPMDVFVGAIPYRLVLGVVITLLVYITPLCSRRNGEFPLLYYGVLLAIYGIHQMIIYSMFVAGMAFFAKISDPRSGGTYMTLLNTLSNLGGTWPSTVVLWLVDPLTIEQCDVKCDTENPTQNCVSDCQTVLDGFFIESLICTIIGIVWLQWGKKRIRKLQSLNDSSWMVSSMGRSKSKS